MLNVFLKQYDTSNLGLSLYMCFFGILFNKIQFNRKHTDTYLVESTLAFLFQWKDFVPVVIWRLVEKLALPSPTKVCFLQELELLGKKN